MDKFKSILNSTFVTTYKRTITVLIIVALTLAIPVTILLVQQQQDIRQQAAGIASVSGKVTDQNNNAAPPGTKAVLVRQSDKKDAKANVKSDGTYTFNVFQKNDTFVLNLELPKNYRVTSFPNDHKDFPVLEGKNIINQDFKIKAPENADIKGRFNTACVNRFSGWACKIKQGGQVATVRFYKVGADGKETLIQGSATQANQPGRTDANFDDPPVGAEAACELQQVENAHVYYFFTPKDDTVKAGYKVVGYVESINGQPVSPRIKLVTSESANGVKTVVLSKIVTLDSGKKIDVCKAAPEEPAKSYSISGIIFVDKDGDKKYNPAKDRPYSGSKGKVIVQRSERDGSKCKNAKECQIEANTGGKFTFKITTPGNYSLDVIQGPSPEFYVISTQHPRIIRVGDAPRSNPADADFGYRVVKEETNTKFSVSGTVFVKQKDGQRVYRGVDGPATITLSGKTTDNKSVKETTTAVVADNGAKTVGSYFFDAAKQVPPGTYTLTISLPAAAAAKYTIITKDKTVKVAAADQKKVDFFLEPKGAPVSDKASISGMVYEETTPVNIELSKFDAGKDKPLAGIKVRLGGDGTKVVTTGADGRYALPELDLGKTYKVSVVEADVSGFRPATPLSREFKLSKTRSDVDFAFLQKVPPGGTTKIAIAVTMPGIGGTAASDNKTPRRTERQAGVIILNATNDKIFDGQTTVTYNPDGCTLPGGAKVGCYRGIVEVPDIRTGVYAIKLRMDNTLYRFVRKNSENSILDNNPLITIVESDTSQLPRLDLISGDLDTEQSPEEKNTANLFDFDKLLSCIRQEASCTADDAVRADFNDDGTVDGLTDLNILYRAFGLRQGE